MKSLLPSNPPERLIENDGDGLKSLRALRDEREARGHARRVRHRDDDRRHHRCG
jgi:hypothetical protein